MSEPDDFSGIATLVVDDGNGASDTGTTTVTFLNLPPTVDAGPDQTVGDGSPVNLAPETFSDPGILDTHTAVIDWGDGTVEAGAVLEIDGSGAITGSHVYDIDGGGQYAGTEFFSVSITVTDDDGGSDSDTLIIEVVSSPEGGGGPAVLEGSLIALSTLFAIIWALRWGRWSPGGLSRRK